MQTDEWTRTEMGYPAALAQVDARVPRTLSPYWHGRAYHAGEPASALELSLGWTEVFDDASDAI
ncbi:hypothetical protein [Variovorax ginsengisoli]|uniref:Uncharacterized protein n=1 Tax=Variovorax ginsengisoli TaxID=363844 RepID=A0ABT9SEB4_9BURK|nr:hypothetical protein [Variovorax ginsengisoli]MDP9902224.1 hypothetical protein [Variovorax ginsengisoli]